VQLESVLRKLVILGGLESEFKYLTSLHIGDREFSLKREAKVKTNHWDAWISEARDGKVDVQSHSDEI
jgi:hypothetical protein